MIWSDMVWCGMVCYGIAWYGLVYYAMNETNSIFTASSVPLKASLQSASADYLSFLPQNSFLLLNNILTGRDSDFVTLFIHDVFHHLFHYDC